MLGAGVEYDHAVALCAEHPRLEGFQARRRCEVRKKPFHPFVATETAGPRDVGALREMPVDVTGDQTRQGRNVTAAECRIRLRTTSTLVFSLMSVSRFVSFMDGLKRGKPGPP